MASFKNGRVTKSIMLNIPGPVVIYSAELNKILVFFIVLVYATFVNPFFLCKSKSLVSSTFTLNFNVVALRTVKLKVPSGR